MTGKLFKSLAVILMMALTGSPAQQYSFAAPQYSTSAQVFSDNELDQMLAPIALYPDPLLAQILPAASFEDQILQAQQLLNGRVDEGLIEGQNWDISVKAIAHYPSILSLMVQSPDWTVAVGQAYVTQEPDVERSIQRLRAQAREEGILQSTAQQQVIVEPNFVRIEPAQPQVIYIPEYDPAAVWGGYGGYYDYGNSALASGVIGFGTGVAIGSWLNRDWDWFGRGPFYHGWRGSGWIGASRGFVNPHNRFYVNEHFRHIDVNRGVVNRNTSNFRHQLEGSGNFRQKPGAAPPGVAAPGAMGAPPPARPGPPPPAATPPAPHPMTPPPAATPPAPHPMTPPRAVAPPAPHPMTPPPAVAPPAPHPMTPPPAAAPPAPHPMTPPPAAAPPAPHPMTPPPAATPPAPHPMTPPPAATPPAPHPMTPPRAVAPPAPHPMTPPPAAAPPAPHPMTPPPAAAPPAPHPMTPPPAAAPPAPHPMAPPPAAAPPAPHPMTPPPAAAPPAPHPMAPPPAAAPPAPHPMAPPAAAPPAPHPMTPPPAAPPPRK